MIDRCCLTYHLLPSARVNWQLSANKNMWLWVQTTGKLFSMNLLANRKDWPTWRKTQINILNLISNHVTGIKSIDRSTLFKPYQRVIEHTHCWSSILLMMNDDATSRRMQLCNSVIYLVQLRRTTIGHQLSRDPESKIFYFERSSVCIRCGIHWW